MNIVLVYTNPNVDLEDRVQIVLSTVNFVNGSPVKPGGIPEDDFLFFTFGIRDL